MQQYHVGGSPGAAGQPPASTATPAAQPQPRPLVQQSNQVVKRMALLGVQQKQLEKPELRKEIVKEPSITFLAFIVDRLLDHILTSAAHSAEALDGNVDEVIDVICNQFQNEPTPDNIFEFLAMPDPFQNK